MRKSIIEIAIPTEQLHPDSTLAAVRLITDEVDEQTAQEMLAALLDLLISFGGIASIEVKPYWKFPGTHEINVRARISPQYVEQPELIFKALGSPWDYNALSHDGVWNAGDDAHFFIPNVIFVWLSLFDERALQHDLNESLTS